VSLGSIGRIVGWVSASGVALVSLGLLACEPQATLRVRGEHDLVCAEGHVEVTHETGPRYRATGCGRTATYTCAEVEETGTPACTRDGAPADAPHPPRS